MSEKKFKQEYIQDTRTQEDVDKEQIRAIFCSHSKEELAERYYHTEQQLQTALSDKEKLETENKRKEILLKEILKHPHSSYIEILVKGALDVNYPDHHGYVAQALSDVEG